MAKKEKQLHITKENEPNSSHPSPNKLIIMDSGKQREIKHTYNSVFDDGFLTIELKEKKIAKKSANEQIAEAVQVLVEKINNDMTQHKQPSPLQEKIYFYFKESFSPPKEYVEIIEQKNNISFNNNEILTYGELFIPIDDDCTFIIEPNHTYIMTNKKGGEQITVKNYCVVEWKVFGKEHASPYLQHVIARIDAAIKIKTKSDLEIVMSAKESEFIKNVNKKIQAEPENFSMFQ